VRRSAAEDVLVRRAAVRLGVQAAVIVAAVVVLVTGAAVVVLLRSQERAAADLLDQAIALADDVEDPPAHTFLVLDTPRGREATPGLPAGAADPAALESALPGGPAVTTEHPAGGVDYRVTTVRRADGVAAQAVLDTSPLRRERDHVLAAMMASGALGLLLAALGGSWLGRRALAPLSEALALQRRFVADAGHELRTPLTLLGTRAQLLRRHVQRTGDGRVPGFVLADADGVVSDSARLAEILDDLLLAADPLADRPGQPVDLTDVCRHAVRSAAAAADEHGVALHGPGADEPPLIVVGSAVALRRAVVALVDNGLRHARRAVAVTVGRGQGLAVVDVTDDGPGVDPELVPRLFHRFATGPAAAGATSAGPEPRRYGLGLALVAEIAAAHHGGVALHRTDATTLRISLPIAPGLQESSEISAPRSKLSNLLSPRRSRT
jgi:two-component system, OmpR family, sensor kinase